MEFIFSIIKNPILVAHNLYDKLYVDYLNRRLGKSIISEFYKDFSSLFSKPKLSQSAIIQQFGKDFTPPDGWTNDPEEIFIQETYQDLDSEGYELLQSLGLKTATPVMAHTRQNGGTLHIFESSGNFYLWNIVEGTVRRFQDKDFDKILQSMIINDGGTKRLQFEQCVIS